MEPEKILEDAKTFALEAGRFLREQLGKATRIDFKGEIDLVTDADRRSQELIRSRIRALYPDHGILAEEGLKELRPSPYRWIVDPLDGTTNFSHGFPVFCVSIAVEFMAEVIAGAVYNPMLDELFTASRGGGAFLGHDGIRVSQIDTLDRSLLATGFPYDIRESALNNLDHFSNFALRSPASIGGAG